MLPFSIPQPTESLVMPDRIQALHAYWQATNYLGAAQLYLKDNVLLQKPLHATDIKARLLGHWGTQPGLNLIYAHLNRLIQDTEANVLLVVGPGHGAPAIFANLFLEGSLGEYDLDLAPNLTGIQKLIQSFSWPYGLPSHLFPGTPGQIHEGGELGYSLSHAFGAVLDNPDLIVACVVGDGEAETGPLAAAWHSNKFLDPVGSGAVLPILHLNGYKLSGPTILGRMSPSELENTFAAYGYQPRLISGDDPARMHIEMWEAMDWAYQEIRAIQTQARQGMIPTSPRWPMLILQTPKGWTCPLTVEDKPIENTSHAHQLPVEVPATNANHLRILENWLKSYHPEQLFDEAGNPTPTVLGMCPRGEKRMGMNPHANGGELLVPLQLPDYRQYAVAVAHPGEGHTEGTFRVAQYLRDVFRKNQKARNFRVVCPDETTSNKMSPLFEATQRAWQGPVVRTDEYLSHDGRVMEILSEHTCQGWLEGYLLTGRHGLFACYEAFIPIVDSMLNQYAKWLKVSKETPWRKPLASLNYLLTSHVWRQDHNGYTHQVPSFIDTVVSKKSSVSRVYLPPDANCLLSVMAHCLQSRDYINLIVANKANQPQWLDRESAAEHCAKGISVWKWAGHEPKAPEVVLAAAGDVPTMEVIAAAHILTKCLPALSVRVVNVVDLLTLLARQDHPHGLEEEAFTEVFTRDTSVIFAFHGYPALIHELIHHQPNPQRFHVRGYMEEGRTTTPFDMLVLNKMSRYHLVMTALERSNLPNTIPHINLRNWCMERLVEHHRYILEHGVDMPEVLQWQFDGSIAAARSQSRQ